MMFPLAFALVALLWEGYKAIGPSDGGEILGVRLLARTDDRAMPHIWDMFSRFGQPEVRGGTDTILIVVLRATWYSFRSAFAAFFIGSLLGVALAVLMAKEAKLGLAARLAQQTAQEIGDILKRTE